MNVSDANKQYDAGENAELRALQSWFDAAADERAGRFDWRLEKVGDALCSVSSSEPSILINRVFGLGSDAEPDVRQLNEIRALYSDAGLDRFFLHVIPGRCSPAILDDAGFENYRGWMKFVRGPGNAREVRTELSVHEIDARHAGDFAAIAGAAFGLKPESFPLLATIVGAKGYRPFMSFDGESPAGTGVVFIDGDHGVFDWGATHPDFRRRGGQTAVLGARVACAAAAGCKHLYTMTGEDVPDDPQHSYSNILRAGFEELYLRENWVPVSARTAP